MKGINGNPALDAYQRVAVTAVNPARGVEKTASVAASPAAETEHAAKVSISSTARELAGRAAGDEASRVEALKNQVEQGTFQVNPQMIAARMLDALG